MNPPAVTVTRRNRNPPKPTSFTDGGGLDSGMTFNRPKPTNWPEPARNRPMDSPSYISDIMDKLCSMYSVNDQSLNGPKSCTEYAKILS